MTNEVPKGYHPGIENAPMRLGWQTTLPWLEKMQNAHRFEGEGGEEVMIHRTDMFTHVRRDAFIGDHLLHYLQTGGYTPAQDMNRSRFFRMNYHHDDPEIIRGDTVTPIKMAMSPKERLEFKNKDKQAARVLASTFMNFLYPDSYDDYVAEQDEILDKMTIYSQLGDVADKLDGLGETFHELRCGNQNFLRVLGNYRKIFTGFEKYDFWPMLKDDPAIQLSAFPTDEEALAMPVLTPDKLHSRANLPVDLLDVPNLPRWYRSWTSMTLNHFDKNPEKFLFPGWYLDLWKKWGIHGQTTHGGVQLP